MHITPQQRDDLLAAVKRGFEQQLAWRRDFHRHPELALHEYRTTATIRKLIAKLGLADLPLNMETGVLAELHGGRPGPVIAVRTDIDALPVREQTGLPFASEVDGCMHACGHDMHMAVVLGAAAVLAKLRKELAGTVRFLFQPAEEMPPGGARPMIANGALKDVAMILGLHVDPDIPVGKIGLRDGATMASVTDFDLIIHGVGGHAAYPHKAVDGIVVAAEIVQSIQKVVSRETSPFSPVVITFGRIEGGAARNVIADHVTLTGTARTLSPEDVTRIPKLIRRTLDGVCKAHGAKGQMDIIASYPVLANSPAANRIFERTCTALFGRGKTVENPASMGGEDFACYLAEVPGAMFRLGIRNKSIGADKGWHSPMFIADEDALIVGAAVMAASVMEALTEGK